jgi:serine carboxypeptidase-like clade 2
MKLCMGREQNTRSKDENLSTELCFVYFSDVVDYSYEDLLSSILPIYQTLLESGIEILVFSGDIDAIVPVTGTRTWLNMLPLNVTESWRPWTVDNQVGGYVTVYDKLTFSTVRGAGHMVPYTQPARALHLFESFINNKPF